jgi:hypothetical protein
LKETLDREAYIYLVWEPSIEDDEKIEDEKSIDATAFVKAGGRKFNLGKVKVKTFLSWRRW